MKASRFNRLAHRWGSIVIAVPTLVVLATGLVLQLKKQSTWVQPPTRRGSGDVPRIAFDRIFEITRGVSSAGVRSWDDIDRLDVRPSKGIVKVRCKNRYEVQIDTITGDVLQVAYRRSDLIESLHDGSFFSDAAKYGLFLPTALGLIGLWGTGVYLFALPYLAKRRNRRRQMAKA